MKKKGNSQEKSDMAEDWAAWNEEFKQERFAKREWSKELVQQFCSDNNIMFTDLQPWHFRLIKDNVKWISILNDSVGMMSPTTNVVE